MQHFDSSGLHAGALPGGKYNGGTWFHKLRLQLDKLTIKAPDRFLSGRTLQVSHII